MQSAKDLPDEGSENATWVVPPNPFDKRWFVHINEKTYGPYTGHQIKKLVDEHKISGVNLVYPEGLTDPEWVQLAQEPILGALFKGVEAPTSSEDNDAVSSPMSRKWLLSIPLVAMLGWVIWPYYAAYDLAVAFRDGEVSTLEARVAWDKVREGLRGDLNAILLQKITSEAKSASSDAALGTGIAAMLGPVIVDRMIDSFVTPQAIALATQETSAKKSSSDSANASKNINDQLQAARRIRWNEINYAFFSGGPFTFMVEYHPGHEPSIRHPIGFRFQWDGNWRLTRVLLPPDAIDGFSSAAQKPSGVGFPEAEKASQSTSSPKPQSTAKVGLPKTLGVTLFSKKFKPSNVSAGIYQDYITIEISITNLTNQDIRAFDGVLTFTDLLDNDILSSKVAINEPIKKGSIINWDGTIKYNQFLDRHQSLKNARQENLKVKFETKKILFADGKSQNY